MQTWKELKDETSDIKYGREAKLKVIKASDEGIVAKDLEGRTLNIFLDEPFNVKRNQTFYAWLRSPLLMTVGIQQAEYMKKIRPIEIRPDSRDGSLKALATYLICQVDIKQGLNGGEVSEKPKGQAIYFGPPENLLFESGFYKRGLLN